MRRAPADTLADEQRHLDLTWQAYEAVLQALSGRRTAGVDEFATEALERMRRERLRLYTESSGPLYFGRIDADDGRVLHIGRHAIADQRNELLAINWRAPAAQPFYTATPADRHGVVRRRRLEIEERTVRGFVDETLAARRGRPRAHGRDRRGHHAPPRRRDAPDHLDDHARAVRARSRRPSRARSSSRAGRGRARPRSACTAQRGCCTPTRRCSAAACWSSARTTSSSPTSARCCRRWARRTSSSARRRRSRPPAGCASPSRPTSPRSRAAAGWPTCSSACSGIASARPRSRSRSSPTASPSSSGRRTSSRSSMPRAGPLPQPSGRPRALPRAAGELDRHTRAGGPARLLRREPRGARDAGAQDEGLPGARDQGVAAGHRGAALRRASSRTASGWPPRPTACSSRGRSTCCCAPARPPARRCGRATCRCSTRRAGWSIPICAPTATWSSTRRRTSRRWSCGWWCAARAASP